MAKFTVDTHLFRELGELLVGRDSTALVELIKNSYDADASKVMVYGEALDDPDRGFVRITDDGVGMTPDEFEQGFLRIASRSKDQGERLSRRYRRRFTGVKGIGRLAAHKLARVLEVQSIPWHSSPASSHVGVRARIDWDLVEQQETLDSLDGTGAIEVWREPVSAKARPGTVVTLSRLRRRWAAVERGRFLGEVQTFEPPQSLVSPLPEDVIRAPLLFKEPSVRGVSFTDPGFQVLLEGAFDAGEDYWQALIHAASWVIEISALQGKGSVNYSIAPTLKITRHNPGLGEKRFSLEHPDAKSGPFFESRILVREGQLSGLSREARSWAVRASGIKVFLEGFRILPYGEPNNDWLSLDLDYTRRTRSLASLDDDEGASELGNDKDVGLTMLRNSSYLGAVFLTEESAKSLRILINREGFVPDGSFETLVKIVRNGIDLATRVRAAFTFDDRNQRRDVRARSVAENESLGARPLPTPARNALESTMDRATSLIREATRLAVDGDVTAAAARIPSIAVQIEEAARISEEIISERAMLRVLASVGTQMTAFIHEINQLLAMSQGVDGAIERLKSESTLPRAIKMELSKLHGMVGDLRRSLERQASYLVDVVTPDARRRRSRQSLAERFQAGRTLVQYQAERKGIEIINEIPPDLKSPPMFPAELTTMFSNLITNAVKAAGEHGNIRAWAERQDGRVRLVVENTGIAVDPDKAERWFKPFESTTVTADPVLGQGMGLGLPITRGMLEDYGAEIRFINASPGYETAVEIIFPS